ncbi:Transcriptional regulator, TetR family, putative (modular protein) [Candidatus Accumulibacter aalborgensis]|uniref:Transcriptional regulator, TetR family, putative (Modular protein) n=1 Tax=Candidatus Accumulibacter aalborgensis TaxID=1860102 RepID=A0A1A8XNJ4_9PROT|nr:TetR/AcrR family transcriptional regulator [Candidatus Accumulibacter aalborgensis]SBT05523.1 Transcriptional regulator, TetR family, putative (modular protein) [Candidatus Accumulibacter aalborgensis]
MPAGRKRQGAPIETSRREDLLRAAARLFVEKGFGATTTRDIAEAVGMRSGSPFYHFRSKQDLLKAAMIEGLETGYRRLQAAIEGIADPEQRLRVMIRTHLGNLLEGDCQAPMLLFETRSLDTAGRAEIAAVADRYQRAWQSTLDELAISGRLRSSARPLRLFLFGMLNWSSQWYRPDGGLSLDEIADAATELLLA